MLTQTVKKILPAPAVDFLRGARKRYRRFSWEKSVRGDPSSQISREQLWEELKALGVERGTDLMVHTSMSKLGYVDGGAEAIIDVLMTLIGPDTGALVWPSHSWPVWPVLW